MIDLTVIWAFIIAFAVAAYVVMDGFDLGIGILFLSIEFIALAAGLALARSITGSVHELFTGTECAPCVAVDLAYQYGGSRTLQSSLAGGPADLEIRHESQQVMAALRYRW